MPNSPSTNHSVPSFSFFSPQEDGEADFRRSDGKGDRMMEKSRCLHVYPVSEEISRPVPRLLHRIEAMAVSQNGFVDISEKVSVRSQGQVHEFPAKSEGEEEEKG